MNFDTLLEPVRFGSLELPNRMFVAAMVTQYAGEDNLPTERWNCYYERKARGGWGIVFTENYGVCPGGLAFKHQAGLWDDAQIPAHRAFVERVHRAGGLIGCQIYHAGRETSSKVTGEMPVAPSALKEPMCAETPRALSVEEIHELVGWFGNTARRAKTCGFDAIEINGGHGYLVNEFMSGFANKRDDEYGGSLENRMRFPLEIVADIRAKVGPEYPLSFRLSTCDYVFGGITLDESPRMARMLQDAGVDLINCTQGMYVSKFAIIPPRVVGPGAFVGNAALVKQAVGIPVVASGRINDPVLAEEILESGACDLVTMARASLADPDLPVKVREGRLEDIVRCIACNEKCTGHNGKGVPVECAVNPALGHEYELSAR